MEEVMEYGQSQDAIDEYKEALKVNFSAHLYYRLTLLNFSDVGEVNMRICPGPPMFYALWSATRRVATDTTDSKMAWKVSCIEMRIWHCLSDYQNQANDFSD